MKRPHRRGLVTLALAGSLGATVLLLPSCSALSPMTTQTSYSPSDGVDVQLGVVGAANLLVVGEKGRQGVLSGALLNRSAGPVAVTIEAAGQPRPVTVKIPAGELVTIGGAGSGHQVVVGDLAQPAGRLLTIALSTPAGGRVEVQVPVLSATGPYATVTPTAVTPTAG